MAEFIEIAKKLQKMCEQHDECKTCPIRINIVSRNNRYDSCRQLIFSHPEETEQIVMEWAKEHPLITNRDKFEEIFGVELNFPTSGCVGSICPKDAINCKNCPHKDFWNKEYKGGNK